LARFRRKAQRELAVPPAQRGRFEPRAREMRAEIGAERGQLLGRRRHAGELAEMGDLGARIEVEDGLALDVAVAAIERAAEAPRAGLDPALDAPADPAPGHGCRHPL